MEIMIKVSVERQIKNWKDIGHLLLELHMIAVLRKGHISNETLINVGNNQVITVVSTWQRLEDWKAWELSKERAEILEKIEPLLAKKTQIKIYEMISPADFDYYIDPESWIQAHDHPHFEG
jgi:antibiotic biosynthesis monooxygenase (ABM) superfamily enzyme